MIKTIYIAPTAEQIDVKIEKNVMSDVERANVVQGNGWGSGLDGAEVVNE